MAATLSPATLEPIKATLELWRTSLLKELPVGGLWARSEVAHKWKATHRSITLRESIAWRTQDLLSQSVFLHESERALGARILLRSAFESVAVLIYLNQETRKVLEGTLDFHTWADKTTQLLLGSRNETTPYVSLSILTILKNSDKRYPGIYQIYETLSESAHPNYEGIAKGYSDVDHENYITNFSNKWVSMYSKAHLDNVSLCMLTFEIEYNEEWDKSFCLLEQWLIDNDAILEATKRDGKSKVGEEG